MPTVPGPSLSFLLVLSLLLLPGSAVADAIALAGEIAPDTGGGTFGLFGQPDLNDDGEVVFFATVDGGTASQGLFVGDGDVVRSVAVAGETAPGGLGSFVDFFFSSGKIDDQGDVGFFASLAGGPAPSGLFLEGQSGLQPIALIGDVAPGSAGTYASFIPPDLNDDGELAFVAVVLALPPFAAVFVESASSGRRVVATGDPVPGVPGASFDGFGAPVINDDGEVAFSAEVDGPGGATSGIWVYSAAGAGTLVALEGEVAPGTGGATFESFGTDPPSIDGVGDVYFEANLSPVAGFDAHFVGDGATITALVLPGDTVPGAGAPTIDSLRSDPEVARNGDVAFIANLEGNVADEGVYLDRAGGARLEVAREDGIAPDTGGGTFLGFSGRAVPNGSGDVAFLAGVFDSPTTTLGVFVPEPTSLSGLLAGTALLSMLPRVRRGLRSR